MIAPWLLETLSREWNWRAALRRIAEELAAHSPSPLALSPRDHALACIDVARALEHVEPDRRFAIASYQQAGPEHDHGRALALAIEAGWWPVVASLAMRERTSTGSLEAMVWEARALLDTGDRERADKLLPITPSDLRLAALRAELSGGSSAVLEQWVLRAQALQGPDASEAFLIAARQARALGDDSWSDLLRLAAQADPVHAGVVAMMIDQSFGDGRRDSRSLLEHLRQRLASFEARGDLSAWCDATRLAAMRLWLASEAQRHRGLARRLLMAALERAYREGLTEISGHLAMWAVLDEAATADQTRTDLLGLVVSALEVPLPAADHIWLAALGAEICAAAQNLSAAHAYAAVVVELAPEHPVVRNYYTGAVAAAMPQERQLEAFKEALLHLAVEPWQELQIDEVAPLSGDELGLAPRVVAPELAAVAIEHALDRADGGADGGLDDRADGGAFDSEANRAVPVMDGDEVMEIEGQWWQLEDVAIGTGTERALEADVSLGAVAAWETVGEVSPSTETGAGPRAGRDAAGGPVHARAETVESGPIGTRGARGEAGRVHARAETVESGPIGTRGARGGRRESSAPMAERAAARGRASSAALPKQAKSQPVAVVPSALDEGWGDPEPPPTWSRRGSRSLASIPPILEAQGLEAASSSSSASSASSVSSVSSASSASSVLVAPSAALEAPSEVVPVAAPAASSGAAPVAEARAVTDLIATAQVRLPTGVVVTRPVPRASSDAVPTSQLRPPTGLMATAPIPKAPGGTTAPGSAAAPSGLAKILPARLATSPAPRLPAGPVAPPARPPSLIPSSVRSALSGGMKPKPLPPVPPPPSARPRARRVTISMDLRMRVGGRELAIQSRDVSTTGLFAVTDELLPIGAEVEAELSVPSSGLSEEVHRVRLRVVRRSKIGYGCELVEPSPELASALSKLTPLGAAVGEAAAESAAPLPEGDDAQPRG